MKRFRRIGAFLNGSPADPAVLSFAGKIAEMADADFLHAVHFNEEGPSPQELPPELDAFAAEVTSQLPASLADRIGCEVHKGSGIGEVLATARNKDLDLAVVGRRLPHSQMAVGAGFMRLARKAPCDVMVVPEQSRPHFGRLLVPVDFSEHAEAALRTAVSLAKASGEPNPQIVCQHVFSCGYGYRSTGLTLAEAVQVLESQAQQEYEQFIDTVETSGVEIEPVYTVSEHRSEVVNDLAIARKMDMVVLGSRGRSRAVASLLGATSEQILVFSAVPTLVVKMKGETSGILDALLGA